MIVVGHGEGVGGAGHGDGRELPLEQDEGDAFQANGRIADDFSAVVDVGEIRPIGTGIVEDLDLVGQRPLPGQAGQYDDQRQQRDRQRRSPLLHDADPPGGAPPAGGPTRAQPPLVKRLLAQLIGV